MPSVCIYYQIIIGERDECSMGGMFQGDGSSRGDECSRGMGVPGDECSGGWVSRGMGVPVTKIVIVVIH